MQSFQDLYLKLNQQQQDAVNAIEGPVMVIAGPGTGKTQILATRILNILTQTDSQPQNILCLTYTEAGATAMQKRLSQFMGAEAFKIPIFTFHGLCNKIIQDHPEKFSRRELRVMDELDKIDLIQGIIESLPAHSLLKSYQEDAQSTRRDLSKIWDLMQSEGISAQDFKTWIEGLLEPEAFKLAFPNAVYKVNRGEFKAGDIKPSEYDKLKKNWARAIEASELFDSYKRAKASAGLYEFSDMLDWVANAFDTDNELLLDQQEQYHYVLVDEYQDTSGLQNRILHQLISYWGDEPNCFVVGDDDQSVYAFQGAKVSNMLDFAKRYKTALKTIVLTQNYRSTQEILNTAKTLIDKNQLRLIAQIPGLSKTLLASGDNQSYPAITPSVKQYVNEFHEAVGVGIDIQALIASGEKPSEIAVLYPLNKHAATLSDAFDMLNIPFVIHRPADILNETVVQHLLTWLEYLSLELELANSGEHLIYKLLMSPLYELSSFEVNQLSVDIYQERSNANRAGEPFSWRQHIGEKLNTPEQADLFSSPPSVGLRELWNNIEHWLKEASWITVPELIQRLYSEGGYLAYALKSQDQEWVLEVLQTFMQFAINMNEKNPFMKIQDFLSIVKKMQNNTVTVPLEKRIGTAEGVQFITAHSSKGLEFEHVFVVRCNRPEWEDNEAGKMPYSITKLLQGKEITLSNDTTAEEDVEERRRLFYVAMTRAKKTLHLSYNVKKITATKISDAPPSSFLFDVEIALPENPNTPQTEHLLFVQEALLKRTAKPKLANDRMDWIQSRINNFKFSPSTLYSILECGLKFYFTRIVRVPDAPSPAAAFGTAMHAAMKHWVDSWTKEKKWLSLSDVVQQFEREMYRQRHGFNERQFKLRMQQGKDLLPLYYEARSAEFKSYEVVLTERNISAVIEGIPITGYLDKIVFHGNRATVIDYKTGKPDNSKKKSAAPGPRSADKLPNPYWFQLGVYQLMTNNQAGKSWDCNMAMIDCVEKDENGDFPLIKLHFDDNDNEKIRHWILQANQKLTSLDFMNGCGKAECYWCKFAKTTEQVVYLPENEDGEDSSAGD
jgi:DNA helicase-2/ATP-dependent DNA helicase PcrA